jgi:hypothetical protein
VSTIQPNSSELVRASFKTTVESEEGKRISAIVENRVSERQGRIIWARFGDIAVRLNALRKLEPGLIAVTGTDRIAKETIEELAKLER